MTLMRSSAVLVVVAAAGALLRAQAPANILTPADVKAATGQEVHVVSPGSVPGAGPGLDLATADNRMLVMVNTGPDTLYKQARQQKEMTIGGTKYPMELFHASVAGVGDEAFDSPPGDTQYVIYLRKGSKAASVSTYLEHGKPRLTMPQLTALAKIVAGRL